MKSILQVSASEVVILGILNQAGVGITQLPLTLLMDWAQRSGRYSNEWLDAFMNVFASILFSMAMLGTGTILYLAVGMNALELKANRTLHMALLGLLFVIWGQAVGASYNSASSIVNYNHQDNDSERRKRIAIVSLCVGLGGVMFVIVYYFALDALELHVTFFGLAVWYVVIGCIRLRWMKRDKEVLAVIPVDAELAAAAEVKPTSQQSLCTLLRNVIVLLTITNVFIGLGTAGSILSSISLMAHELEENAEHANTLTFYLMLTFLLAQTMSRLINAVIYAYTNWPYVSAVWQNACVLGMAIFLTVPNTTGAYVSAVLVGASFGGFHSGFPVIAATSFPGYQKIDYPQSLGVCMFISALGLIVIGQIAKVVYETSSLYGMFVFVTSIQAVSGLAALFLAQQIRLQQQKLAIAT